jgi:hypothetical protein
MVATGTAEQETNIENNTRNRFMLKFLNFTGIISKIEQLLHIDLAY